MAKKMNQKKGPPRRNQGAKFKKTKEQTLKTKNITKNELKQLVYARLRKETINRQKKVSQIPAENIKKEKLPFEKVLPLIQKEHLNCPICLDICVLPVLTECGHYYCLSCFQNVHKLSQHCCVCRNQINITEYQPSEQLQKLFQQSIRLKFDRYKVVLYENHLQQVFDRSEVVLYKNRLEQARVKQMKRKIPTTVNIGDKVDFKQFKFWVEAEIAAISESQFEIKYPIQHRSFQAGFYKSAIVNKNSRLLAAHRTFTVPKETKKKEEKQNQIRRPWVQQDIQIRPTRRSQLRLPVRIQQPELQIPVRIQQPEPQIPPIIQQPELQIPVRIQQPEPQIPPRRQQLEPQIQAIQIYPQAVSWQNNQESDRNWQIILMRQQPRNYTIWFAQQLQHNFTWSNNDLNLYRDEEDIFF